MAFLDINNVRIAGFCVAVPRQVSSNLNPKKDDCISDSYSPEEFVKTTGVQERRVSRNLTTSDLCYESARKLIAELGWDKSEIDALIFVSQTPDYLIPSTSCILQDRLGLSKDCYAYDCTLGCSGWVYGVSQVGNLLSSGNLKKALLLCGDANESSYKDPLFGHAGAATAIEYKRGESGFKCHFGTDGSGYDAIIIPDGGARHPFAQSSLDDCYVDGRLMNRLQTHMNGLDVFSFGISTAPKSIKLLGEHFNFNYLNYDYFILHQANMKMNNMIVKKLKLPEGSAPSSMLHFGNTSSASIPLTIISNLKHRSKDKTKYICCGFGVGLSWGTIAFETEDIVICDLLEIDKVSEDREWL